MASNADYITFSASEGSLASKAGNGQYEHAALLKAVRSPACWNDKNEPPLFAPEELGLSFDYLEDLAFSSSSAEGPGNHANSSLKNPAWAARFSSQSIFCWKASSLAVGDWLKIDLQRIQWLTSFKYAAENNAHFGTLRLEYSLDDTEWEKWRNMAGLEKLLKGDVGSTITEIVFHQPLLARYIRFTGHATTIPPTTAACLKVQVFGCPATCFDPLGVENMDVPDEQLSSTNGDYPGWGRLNWIPYGLTPVASYPPPNLIVDLAKPSLVTAIQIQGCFSVNFWVSHFRVQYRIKLNEEWNELKDKKGMTPLTGNSESKKAVMQVFESRPINGRFFNVIPVTWSGGICYKIELLGCKTIPNNHKDDLAANKVVVATPVDPLMRPASGITTPSFRRSTCTRILGGTIANKPMLTIDLGSSKPVTSVEITTPHQPTSIVLAPDGLWPFTIISGGNDLSTNQNNALIGDSVELNGDGFDGRKYGALIFSDTSTVRSVVIPTRGVNIDPKNGWSLFVWLFIPSGTLSTSIHLFRTAALAAPSFDMFVAINGSFAVTYDFDVTVLWEAYSATALPRDRWVFVGVTIDCQSGTLSHIIDAKPAEKRYIGVCPSTSPNLHTTNTYAVMSSKSALRVSCLQIYRRPLDMYEIEMAETCPGLPPAPSSLHLLNCSMKDLYDTSVNNNRSFTAVSNPVCSNFRALVEASYKFSNVGDGLGVFNGPQGPFDLGQSSFTIVLHFMFLSYGSIFGWWSDANTFHSGLLVDNRGANGSIQLAFDTYCRNANSSVLSSTSNFSISIDAGSIFPKKKLVYVGIVFDHSAQKLSLMVEGDIVKSIVTYCPFGLATNSQLFRVATKDSKGSASCLQTYRYALSRSQLQAIRRCPMTSVPNHRSSLNIPMDADTLTNQNIDDRKPLLSSPVWAPAVPWAPIPHLTKSMQFSSPTIVSMNGLTPSQSFGNSTFMMIFNAFNADASGSPRPLVSLTGPNNARLTIYQIPTTRQIQLVYVCSGAGTRTFNTPTNAYLTNRWHQISITLGFSPSMNDSVRLYIDGMTTIVGQVSSPCSSPLPTNTLHLGSEDGVFFTGRLTGLAIYQNVIDKATQAELQPLPLPPTRVEGRMCDSDLLSHIHAKAYFSSVFTTVAGVPSKGYNLYDTWIGNSSTAESKPCCWQPANFNVNEWITADLGEERIVTSVTTMGDESTGYYITQYKISWSKNNRVFIIYADPLTINTEKTFSANWDTYQEMTHAFSPPITARFIRLHPVTWQTGIGLRWALRGCRPLYCNVELNDGDVLPIVSSAVNTYALPRLLIDSDFEWVPIAGDTKPWIQFSFRWLKTLLSIQVQGSKNQSAWITKYHLLQSQNSFDWQAYTWGLNGSRIRIFDGPTWGPNAPAASSYLSPPASGQMFRIVVDEYYSQPIGRFGLKGCTRVYSDSSEVTAITRLNVRISVTNPNLDTAVAATLPQCGISSGTSFGNSFNLVCGNKPIKGRYVTLVQETYGSDMFVCGVKVFNDAAINLAFGKVVTASSEINPIDALRLTDGKRDNDFIGVAGVSSWFRINLGSSQQISRVVITTGRSWWNPTLWSWATLKTQSRLCDSQLAFNMTCDGTDRIYVHQAFYGRVDSNVCSITSDQCPGYHSSVVLNYVRNQCHMKQHCNITNFGQVSGLPDPCPSSEKVFGIDWHCIDPDYELNPSINVRIGDNDANNTANALCDYLSLARNGANPLASGTSHTFYCIPPVKGRYVIVEKRTLADIRLSEIMAFGN